MKMKIILEAPAGDLGSDISETTARSHVLHDAWQNRRRIAWTVEVDRLSERTVLDRARHQATLAVINTGEVEGRRTAVLRLSIDIEGRDAEDGVARMRRVLDLPRAPVPGPNRTTDDDLGSFARLKGETVIGPMPDKWPVGRRLTGFSTHLGSYGQGGVGLCGWQLNNGSWLILPLKDSSGWMWLTCEEVEASSDRMRLEIEIDQRVLGAHPSQIDGFHPWAHAYGGADDHDDMPDWNAQRAVVESFHADDDGFVMQTGGSNVVWRFEMGNTMPRPPLGGSGAERVLVEGESVEKEFLLTHDCYLDV